MNSFNKGLAGMHAHEDSGSECRCTAGWPADCEEREDRVPADCAKAGAQTAMTPGGCAAGQAQRMHAHLLACGAGRRRWPAAG
jgi:hypothetical protein